MDAKIKTIDSDWIRKWEAQFTDNVNIVRLISPFINSYMVDRLIKIKGERQIQVITRYNLNDFFAKASDIKALEKLVENGIEIKGIQDLHSKVYIFDTKSVIIASANFTSGGFIHNKEFGVLSDSQPIVLNSINYFQSLWSCTNELLTQAKIDDFKKELDKVSKSKPITLDDYGANPTKKALGDKKYFVKFYGNGNDRISPNHSIRDQIIDTHCHFAVTFPKHKKDARPRKMKDGDIIFIARMVEGGGYAIFGKTIARTHVDKRDVASVEDRNEIPWKKDYPIYIRVHSGEFIDALLENCPDMKNLMRVYKEYSFRSTKDSAEEGRYINPNNSLRQKAYIELSEESAIWLIDKFETAKKTFGLIPQSFIDNLYQGVPKI